jgi:CarD family transcriptional regulator
VNFKKGDTVIYPQHGACIVHGIKKMKAFGATQEYLILKTVINEMTLSAHVQGSRCRCASAGVAR